MTHSPPTTVSAAPIRGIAYMGFAMFLLTVGDALTKWVGTHLPVGQVIFFRALFIYIPIVFIIHRSGGLAVLRVTDRKGLIIRALFYVSATATISTSMILLPLAEDLSDLRTQLAWARAHDDERVHAHLGIVALLLDEARVDDVVDAVDGERRLGDVRGDDALTTTWRSRLKDPCLLLARKSRVHGKHVKFGNGGTQGAHALEKNFSRRVDFLLTGEEEQNVTLWFGEVNLHHRYQRGV